MDFWHFVVLHLQASQIKIDGDFCHSILKLVAQTRLLHSKQDFSREMQEIYLNFGLKFRV